jgi:hypothetical protein
MKLDRFNIKITIHYTIKFVKNKEKCN